MDAIEMHRQQPVRLLGWEDLRAKGITSSNSTIYKRISEGEFPKPVKLGTKSVGWPEDEVAAYIDARIAARDVQNAEGR